MTKSKSPLAARESPVFGHRASPVCCNSQDHSDCLEQQKLQKGLTLGKRLRNGLAALSPQQASEPLLGEGQSSHLHQLMILTQENSNNEFDEWPHISAKR